MAKLFRCNACVDPLTNKPGVHFDGPKPVCPTCAADTTQIDEIECIHFDPPSGKPGRGMRAAACDTKLKIGSRPKLMMTGEPSAVTCKDCRQTPIWKLEADVRGIPQPEPTA